MLGETGFRLEILLKHPMTFCIHCPGVRRSSLKNLKCEHGIETRGTRELQSFRKHRAVQSKNEIQDKLHSRAASCGSDVEGLFGALGEDIGATLERSAGTAADQNHLPCAHLPAGASDSCIQVLHSELL